MLSKKVLLNYKNKVVFIILMLFIIYSGKIFSQQKLFLENGKDDYSIGSYISVIEDKEYKLSINEASSDSMKKKYIYYNKETLNLRFTTSVFWLRLIIVDTLSNPASGIMAFQNSRTWILIKNEPAIEDIRLYQRDLNFGGNKFTEIKAGSVIPVSEKAIKTNDFIGGLHVQKNVPDTVYLRIQTKSQFILSFNMLTTAEYAIHSSKKYLVHGILFGILLLLLSYNTLLYFSIKDKVYIFYSLYILCYTFYIFSYEGYFFEIFGRNFYNDYFILPTGSVSITGVFLLLLTREFLSTKICLPWAYKLLTYLTPLPPIICICIFAFTTPWLVVILAVIVLGSYILGMIIAFITLKKGVVVSKYYLIALSGTVIGVLIYTTTRNGLLPIPYNIWTQNSVNFGILWEALVLAATVGYRFSNLKAETEIEKTLMRNQIAADLHDEIGSNLSTISLQSRMMMKDIDMDNNSRNQLQNIMNIASITTDTIRDIVWFINPFHDKSEDLVLRMKELASKMLVNITYVFKSDGSIERIFDLIPDLNKRRHIYLIFKEALNNIMKHSKAKEVSISLKTENKKFIMIIADNGKGFNEEEIKRGDGLKNLKNRAAIVGAQIFIESIDKQGTKIMLEVPL